MMTPDTTQRRSGFGWRLTAVWLLAILAACSTPPAPNKPDEPPVADAGDDQDVPLGSQVTLDASRSSDPEGQGLSYAWTAGNANPASVVLTGTRVVRFTPVTFGRYLFILVVSADQVPSPPDSMYVNVVGDDNRVPRAEAGPDYALPLGSTFYLDGAGSSDADGDSLSLLWEVVVGATSVIIADSSAAQTEVTPQAPGTYTFRLTVSDGQLAATDEITILVTSAGNVAPVANAGLNQTIAVGSLVTLDGSGSADLDDDPLTYLWSVGNNPGEPVTLSSATATSPTFTPNLLGDYVFGLVVSDPQTASLLDTMVVTVVAQIYNRRSGMIEVPAGPFVMGTEAGFGDETPVHTVEISTFWIDSVEVTAAQYALCLGDGDCSSPSQSPGCNHGLAERSDHPINCVDAAQAASFCGWAGKRLPTEAEWEKAARGPNDERRFPWGDEDPNLYLLSNPELRLLNYNNLLESTARVGQHPDGVSPYGIHNLAGNVMEWVLDFYDPDFYTSSPNRDPQGPASGQQRVARGGHYLAPREAVTVSVRVSNQPNTRSQLLGFRCARSSPPP